MKRVGSGWNWPSANFPDGYHLRSRTGVRGSSEAGPREKAPPPNNALQQLAFPVRSRYVVRSNIRKVYGLQRAH